MEKDVKSGVWEPVDIAAVDRFGTIRKDGNFCPVCECPDWYVMQDPGKHLSTLAVVNAEGVVLQAGSYPLVALACQRCGFLHMHVKSVFEEFMKGRKDDDKESE